MRDWRNELRSRLQQLQIEVDPLSTRQIEYVYFAAVGRLIDQRPRTVHKAREFRIPNEHRKAVSRLRKRIELGQDLRPHQNRSILSTASPDRLLNDWGIHHLHIGFGKLDSDGFAPRTKDVLFVMFQDDEAFLLTMRPHGKGHGELWAEIEFLEIIRRNWPQFLSSLAPEASGVGNLSPREILKGREAGVMPLVVLSDGVSYMPIKGGFSTDGTPWYVCDIVDQWITRIQDAERLATDAFDVFVARTLSVGKSMPDQVALTMQVVKNRIQVKVGGTDVVWDLEP